MVRSGGEVAHREVLRDVGVEAAEPVHRHRDAPAEPGTEPEVGEDRHADDAQALRRPSPRSRRHGRRPAAPASGATRGPSRSRRAPSASAPRASCWSPGDPSASRTPRPSPANGAGRAPEHERLLEVARRRGPGCPGPPGGWGRTHPGTAIPGRAGRSRTGSRCPTGPRSPRSEPCSRRTRRTPPSRRSRSPGRRAWSARGSPTARGPAPARAAHPPPPRAGSGSRAMADASGERRSAPRYSTVPSTPPRADARRPAGIATLSSVVSTMTPTPRATANASNRMPGVGSAIRAGPMGNNAEAR